MSATGTERAPWLCPTCTWGFPESLGYSCVHLEGHICSHVVVACEEYRRKHDYSHKIPAKKETDDERD